MAELLKDPTAATVIILAILLFTGIVLIAFLQGKDISTPWGSISEPKKPNDQRQVHAQQQNVNVPIYIYEPEEVKERVEGRVRDIVSDTIDIDGALYKPPRLPERIEYIYAVRWQIERWVREIVLTTGGGWSGSSMAHFFTYLENSKRILPEYLINEIKDYYAFTQEFINDGTIYDNVFLQIQILAMPIIEGLESFDLDRPEYPILR